MVGGRIKLIKRKGTGHKAQGIEHREEQDVLGTGGASAPLF